MDILARSIPGIFIYGLVFPVVFFPLGFNKLQPEISWIFAISMLLVSSLRLVHSVYTHEWYTKTPGLWRAAFYLLSLLHGLILGIFFAMTLYDPLLEPIRVVAYIAIGGVCGGALISLTPRLKFALSNLAVLIVPSIIVSALVLSNYPLAFMLLIYSVYLCFLGQRTHSEYIRSFEIESQLHKQREELEQINKIDPLTHIYNRGYFNTAYDIQWHHGIRQKQSLSFLLIDIDHFKSINDTYGHLYGDKCLIHVANLIANAAKRKTDLVARFGGEEFAILLPNTGAEAALDLAEQLRHLVESSPFTYQHSELAITISIGLASTVPALGINSNSLIEKADTALYEAKNQGRNRVCNYIEPSLPQRRI